MTLTEAEYHYVHVFQVSLKIQMEFVNSVMNHALNVAFLQIIVMSVMELEHQHQLAHAHKDTTKLPDKQLVNHVILHVVDVPMLIHVPAVTLHTT